MKICDCEAQPDAECLSCILGLSDLENRSFRRFLEDNLDGLKSAGLSSAAVESIIEAFTD